MLKSFGWSPKATLNSVCSKVNPACLSMMSGAVVYKKVVSE